MRLDASIAFVPVGSPLPILGTASQLPSNVIDGLGVGPGIAPPNIFGAGNPSAVFGADLGIGLFRMLIQVATGTAFATSNSATMNIAFQGAPDSGAAGGYQPGTWQTFSESGYLTAAQMGAGKIIYRGDWSAAFPDTEAGARPRFYRLLFQTLAATAFTAGTIANAIVTPTRDDTNNLFVNKNYAVA
jgi:hypothetical protein